MKLHALFRDLEGKSVFISGGGSGIGASLTEGFVAQGCKVAFCQRSDATQLCDRLEADYGNRPVFIPCDVTDMDALKDTLEQAAGAIGTISVLVNNAARDDRHSLENLSPEEWDRLLNVNIKHHYFAIQAVAGGMRSMYEDGLRKALAGHTSVEEVLRATREQ